VMFLVCPRSAPSSHFKGILDAIEAMAVGPTDFSPGKPFSHDRGHARHVAALARLAPDARAGDPVPHLSPRNCSFRVLEMPLRVYVSGAPVAVLPHLRLLAAAGPLRPLRRNRNGAAMKLTERDGRLLGELGRFRWLSTGQIARLLFPANHLTAVHRRLRVLRVHRYVISARAHRMAQALHTLGLRGREVLLDREWPGEIRLEKSPPRQLEHFVGINDIRIAVTLAAGREGVAVEYFRPCWELHPQIWPFRVIPDAVAMFTHAERSARMLFEYDRGFEPPAYMLRTKFSRYAEGLEGFPFSQVVTVVETEARLAQLKEYTARHLPECGEFAFITRGRLLDSWSVAELLH
jgi:hypothetical protein